MTTLSYPLNLILPAVLLVVCLICAGSDGQQNVYIGNTVFLPTTSVTMPVTPLRQIFEGNLSRFLVEEQLPRVLNNKNFYDSSESTLGKLSATVGISAPIKVVQFSLEQTFSQLTGSQTNVTSSLVYVESYSKRVFLRQEVVRKVERLPLRADFLADLGSLPDLPSPTPDNDWGRYLGFLERWGSHYMSAIYYGSWLRQWSVAASSRRYSERQMEAKACAKLMGPQVIPSVGGCAGFTNAELQEALQLQTNDEIEVRGGNPSTAAQITLNRTDALIKSFIEEGRTSDHVVNYNFVPIWRPVLDTYPSSSKEWRVATALQAYFDGFRAFSCPRQALTLPTLTLQQMQRKTNGFYECVHTCVGCKRDQDCNLAATGGCYCYGNSCIIAPPPDYKPVVQTQRDNLPRNALPNRSCQYSFPKCVCNTISKEPDCRGDGFIPIWSQDVSSLHVM